MNFRYAILLILLAGCGGGAPTTPTILLTVTADDPVPAAALLRVTVSSNQKVSLPVDVAIDPPAPIPPKRSVRLQLPPGTGTVRIDAEARSASGEVLARGSVESAGPAATLSLMRLPVPIADGGVSDSAPASDLAHLPLQDGGAALDLSATPTDANAAPPPPSCAARPQTECASLPVPGGAFRRSYDGTTDYPDPSFPATVSDFQLDQYEVTVGRFRAFINSGWRPSSDAGAHPKISGSGWQSAWPLDLAGLPANLKCAAVTTWTDAPGASETLPINCVNWYEAFAFCVWDGGRLPTEAEWNYAAAGGGDQRGYPWGSTIDDSKAVYCGASCAAPQPVGSKPAGAGRWGQLDLAGNVWEWVLDGYGSYATPCVDCATLSGANRSLRGGNFAADERGLRVDERPNALPDHRDNSSGFRCAR